MCECSMKLVIEVSQTRLTFLMAVRIKLFILGMLNVMQWTILF